jgi:6-pyruvoyltetrahydropterin/6-carboxytetrahydropterin synthase
MTDYRVAVGKEALVFAAAHFITFGHGGCEPLHGHNYRVGVTLAGDLDRHSMVYDFVALRRDMQAILAELDHRVILPQSNPDLEVESSDDQVEVRHASRRYVFPRSDAVLLPVSNTTAENLAEYLGGRLETHLRRIRTGELRHLEVEVEETPGQSAFWTREPGP